MLKESIWIEWALWQKQFSQHVKIPPQSPGQLLPSFQKEGIKVDRRKRDWKQQHVFIDFVSFWYQTFQAVLNIAQGNDWQ